MKDISRNEAVIRLATYDDSKTLVLSRFSGNQRDPHLCEVQLRSGQFSFQGVFYFDNYSEFVSSVEGMALKMVGCAVLKEDYKEQIIKLEITKLGHVLVSGNIEQHSEFTQALTFGFKTDQTSLAPFGKDLRKIIE